MKSGVSAHCAQQLD